MTDEQFTNALEYARILFVSGAISEEEYWEYVADVRKEVTVDEAVAEMRIGG